MSDERIKQLRFLFKVDYIEPNEASPKFDGDGLWFPQNGGDFETKATTGWLLRTPDQVTLARDQGVRDFSVCSLIYRSSTSHFLAVPADCRNSDIRNHTKQTGYSWRRVRFKNDESQDLSIATFSASNLTLAGRGSRDWVPELLPATYNDNYSSRVPFTHLTGELALIVGFIAFSCPKERDPSNLAKIMQTCFKPPLWNRHGLDPERIDRHGVVVTIRADPEAGNLHQSEQDLRKYQDGHYGALLISLDSPSP
ncbi:hypothetical protein FQN49_003506 [Arthroderma sp. PD_2]|nr:hypothetical protein FQN49_003506 [Arthroderma sp. PD_2]